jgi:fluoroquinolone resistance protein
VAKVFWSTRRGEDMTRLFGDQGNVDDAIFTDLDGGGSHVADREFYRCTFNTVKLAEAQLERIVLEQCTFTDCDLTRCALKGVSLRGVTFTRCKLLGVDFSRISDNPDVSFDACILRYAAFAGLNLRNTTFSTCELQEAQFEGTSLVAARFPGSNVTGATWTRCDLSGSDFSLAEGLALDVRTNRVKDAYVPVETAVRLAQEAGLRVVGYDRPKPRRG